MGELQPGANLTAHLPTSGQAEGGPGAVAASFAAGVLQYLPQLMVWTLPSVPSYDRMQPHTWSGAFKCARRAATAPPFSREVSSAIWTLPSVACCHCVQPNTWSGASARIAQSSMASIAAAVHALSNAFVRSASEQKAL